MGGLMKFLVVTKSREAMPPEMALPALQMMKKWVAVNRASGKLVDTWAFAGTLGGGGILDVETADELDAIMGKFPFAGTSSVEVYPLTNMDDALDRGEANITEIMTAMQAAAG